jgi:FlaA1/EpsC-like NDP-sugar epimerase
MKRFGDPTLKIATPEKPRMFSRPSDHATERSCTPLQRCLRQVACAVALLPVFVGSYYLSYCLRFDWQLGPNEWRKFGATVAYVVMLKAAVFGWFRIYQGWSRFVTFYDLVVLVQASVSSLLLTILVDRYLLPVQLIPRSVFLLDCGTTIVVIGGSRALLRAVHERNWMPFVAGGKIPALIVGANEAGESLLRAIRHNDNLDYQVMGFLDDDLHHLGCRIGGVPVVGTIAQACQLAERYGVTELLIAGDALPGRQMRSLVEEARGLAIRVKVLPSYEQLITGSVAIQPQPVSIHDLLRREPIQLEMDNLRQWIDGRTLMVTGSSGSIGSEICRQLLRFSPRRLVLVDRSENGQFFLERELRALAPAAKLEVCLADILDQERMRNLLDQYRPEIIFHAAAYKHVPLMESHPGEAVKNIVMATQRLADLAMARDVQSFVMISTDKAINPTSVMGACKRAAELYVQSLTDLSACHFITVRFGNVLDSAGSVVQVFRQQIAAGGPVTVTDERMQRYFMTIPEAARLVVQAGIIGNSGEILMLDMGDPVRIVDMAADMIRLSGLEVGEDIEIKVVGLRPGEKLFEELQAVGEKHLPTRHPKIRIADRQHRDPHAMLVAVERLTEMADDDPGAIVEQLRSIVPEYRGGRVVERPDLAAA